MKQKKSNKRDYHNKERKDINIHKNPKKQSKTKLRTILKKAEIDHGILDEEEFDEVYEQ